MTPDKLNNTTTEININYDQEYDEMSLDLMLDNLKFEEKIKRRKKLINVLITWGGWFIAFILYIYIAISNN